jgi:hypothetical protein
MPEKCLKNEFTFISIIFGLYTTLGVCFSSQWREAGVFDDKFKPSERLTGKKKLASGKIDNE